MSLKETIGSALEEFIVHHGDELTTDHRLVQRLLTDAFQRPREVVLLHVACREGVAAVLQPVRADHPRHFRDRRRRGGWRGVDEPLGEAEAAER